MGTGRFERLERARAKEPDPGPRSSALETRFGRTEGARPDTAPAHSGAPPDRFEEPAADGPLRALDTDRGQAFVRCAHCRADSHVTATRCSQCEADLETPEQRAFNEALFRRLVLEKEEEDQKVQALRERQARAQAEQADAMRQRRELEAELRRRRELGLPLEDGDDVRDPLRTGGRSLGRFLGQTLVRLVPNRNARLAVLVAIGLGIGALFVVFPSLLVPTIWVALVLGGLARRRRTG